jgi:DNA-directed RNA polymerase subunit E'/Rpb7
MASTTLRNWRWCGRGPQSVKIGDAVRYRLIDVEAFEQQHLSANTTADGGAR